MSSPEPRSILSVFISLALGSKSSPSPITKVKAPVRVERSTYSMRIVSARELPIIGNSELEEKFVNKLLL